VGIALVALVVVVVGYAAYESFTDSDGMEGGVFLGTQAQGHEQGPIAYETIPPAGGVHNPAWQNCGIYDQPVASENAVHSLEHGAVWITYEPNLAADAVEQLRNVARGRGYVLLSPFPGLPAPVVASAWGIQLRLDSAGDERLPQFISEYAQGSQTPEPGAPCTGGVGDPIG
jgi:hypothetical protein